MRTKREFTVQIWIAHKNDQRKVSKKMHFFYEKDSRFSPGLIHKSSFLIGQVQIEKYGLKTQFLLFNI